MLLITCPWCGRRNEDEFHYGGAAHVPYPSDPHALDDLQWSRYLFYRANPKGRFNERWSHAAGCRRWFNAVRDTATGELISTYSGPAPAVECEPRASPGTLSSAQIGPQRAERAADERLREEELS